MDTITYLLISLLLFLPWATIYVLRPHVRKKMLKTSIIGGVAGFVAELWYFRDYWHPPTVEGQTVISVEDFLFGFTITGLSVTVLETFFKFKTRQKETKHKRVFALMFLFGVLNMMFFNVLLGFNSIVVSSASFLVLSLLMVILRPALLWQSFISGILMLGVILPVYLLLFDFLNTDYWDQYWLLARTPLGITVLGNIPLTELVWYFSWGSFAGVAHSFVSGNAKYRVYSG